jgi:hypothetical protein
MCVQNIGTPAIMAKLGKKDRLEHSDGISEMENELELEVSESNFDKI